MRPLDGPGNPGFGFGAVTGGNGSYNVELLNDGAHTLRFDTNCQSSQARQVREYSNNTRDVASATTVVAVSGSPVRGIDVSLVEAADGDFGADGLADRAVFGPPTASGTAGG